MKKQLLTLLVALLGTVSLFAQTCLSDGIELTRQTQIDSFSINYPTCTEILGDVLISESAPNDITNLNGLNQVLSINGSLSIVHNASLTNLAGLDNLTSIGVDLRIINNPLLEDLLALSNLATIDGLLDIASNLSLTSLEGLENIETLGSLLLNYNALTSFSGLNNLETIENGMNLLSNSHIVDFTGLENLSSVGFTAIYDYDNLVSFSGLSSLEYIFYFCVHSCDSLLNVSGLENVDSIGSISIKDNPVLENLDGLENAYLDPANNIEFKNNPSLALCGQSNICNFITLGGAITLVNNAPGCNTVSEILEYCFANVDHTNLIGQLIADFDQDCETDSSEPGISNWLAHVTYNDYSYAVSTDDLGNYWIPVIAGDWNLNITSPSAFWTPCFEDSLIQATGMNDTIVTDFFMQPLGDCSFVDWDISMPDLRPCETRTLVVDYCNYGTQPAEDAIILVSLDSFLTFQGASLPHTIDSVGNVLFEFDELDVFECGQFTMDVFVDCDSLAIWDVQCVHAQLLNEDLCSPDSLWDGSTIMVNGVCDNDSIRFELENIGAGNMTEPAQFRVEIVIDDIVLLQDVDDYQLEVGELQMLSYPLDGMNILGMRLEADQTPGHPASTAASVVVPNCEDVVNNIILNLLPAEDGNPFEESFCGVVLNSYDPNIKTAQPIGIGADHEIDKTWKLDYTVEFQNTGNDTAFLVVLKDTLSENLDLTSLRVRGSSHPFTWSLKPGRELVFTFENILLPDSTTNELESQGFVNFSITPKSDLLPGSLIENRVGIYFDFNDPIITNTVFHTIRKPVVTSSEHLDWCAGTIYQGQEIWQDTSIQILTEFAEYDSVHVVHLDVVLQTESTLMIEVETGTYFEDVLISGDTTFTITYSNQNDCDSLVTYIVDSLTDLDEVNQAFRMAKVYPNPVDDFLLVLDHETAETQHWELVDNLGRAVWEKQLSANNSLSEISMKALPPGVYLLQVKTDKATAVWKVVKQ